MIEIKVLASSSRGNCYHITDGVTPLLLECGIPWKQIQKGLDFKTSEIKGCLVSHEHKDHCKAWHDVATAGIELCASAGTIEAAQMQGHRVFKMTVKLPFTIGTWTILPFETQHDAAEPLGYLLANKAGDKLLFATDTYYIKYKFTGLTHLMIECNHSYDILDKNVENGYLPLAMKKRLMQSHFSLENVKKFLLANDLSKVQEIYLIHLSTGNSNEAEFKNEIQKITGKPVHVAQEGDIDNAKRT